jgi:muramidase (phage lysozyme)
MALNQKEQLLSELFTEAAKDLLARVKSGEATAQDYKNIIQFLRDNGITAEVRKGSPLAALAQVLPFTDEEVDGTYN